MTSRKRTLSAEKSVPKATVCKIAKIKNIRIYEVGISYYGRTYEEGKKITWLDGFVALWVLVKYRFTE